MEKWGKRRFLFEFDFSCTFLAVYWPAIWHGWLISYGLGHGKPAFKTLWLSFLISLAYSLASKNQNTISTQPYFPIPPHFPSISMIFFNSSMISINLGLLLCFWLNLGKKLMQCVRIRRKTRKKCELKAGINRILVVNTIILIE